MSDTGMQELEDMEELVELRRLMRGALGSSTKLYKLPEELSRVIQSQQELDTLRKSLDLAVLSDWQELGDAKQPADQLLRALSAHRVIEHRRIDSWAVASYVEIVQAIRNYDETHWGRWRVAIK